MKQCKASDPAGSRRRVPSWVLAALVCACGHVAAEPGRQVQIDFEGTTLNAWLTEVEQPRASVLMLHGTMAHANMEIMATLAEVFSEYEIETLRVSLSLGVTERSGMFPCDRLQDHRQEDALAELAAWMQWLDDQGRDSVVILGHSRGGGQVARFAASARSPGPEGLVLVAPAVRDPGDLARAYDGRGEAGLDDLVGEARGRVEEGMPDSALEGVAFLNCGETDVTARSFLSYYGDDDGIDALDVVDELSMPVLVIAGSDDPLTARLGPAGEALAAAGKASFVQIDGADHFFRDLYAYDVAEAVVGWLGGGEQD